MIDDVLRAVLASVLSNQDIVQKTVEKLVEINIPEDNLAEIVDDIYKIIIPVEYKNHRVEFSGEVCIIAYTNQSGIITSISNYESIQSLLDRSTDRVEIDVPAIDILKILDKCVDMVIKDKGDKSDMEERAND